MNVIHAALLPTHSFRELGSATPPGSHEADTQHDALFLIRNSIDRTVEAADQAPERDSVRYSEELLKALGTLEFLAKSLTANEEDQERLARLAACIDRLSTTGNAMTDALQ